MVVFLPIDDPRAGTLNIHLSGRLDRWQTMVGFCHDNQSVRRSEQGRLVLCGQLRASLKPEDIVTPGPVSPEFLNWFWRLKLQDYQVGHMKTMATRSWSAWIRRVSA